MAKEWDPTIVSAKDIGIARANAVTAVYTVEAARIAAGLEEADVEALNAEIESIFNESVSKFDHPRIGSANKNATPTVEQAAANVQAAMGDNPGDYTFGGKSKHAGRTIAQVFADPKAKGYIEWAAGEKNKNDESRAAAAAFMATQV